MFCCAACGERIDPADPRVRKDGCPRCRSRVAWAYLGEDVLVTSVEPTAFPKDGPVHCIACGNPIAKGGDLSAVEIACAKCKKKNCVTRTDHRIDVVALGMTEERFANPKARR